MTAGRDRRQRASTAESTSGRRPRSRHCARSSNACRRRRRPRPSSTFQKGSSSSVRATARGSAAAAARGQVTLYAIQIDVFSSDASTAREPVTRGPRQGARERRARRHRRIDARNGRAGDRQRRQRFARLALELSGYYLLGFEPESGDRDGKPHRIKVTVPGRSAVDIRARSQFSIDRRRARPTMRCSKKRLEAPVLATEIGSEARDLHIARSRERQAPHPDGGRNRSREQSRWPARAGL